MKKTFAVGDIHGCLESLKLLIAKCLEAEPDPKFVFLGDYVDRGPDSKGVVDLLMALGREHECVFLRGNHEDMLLHHHSGFLGNGGVRTMSSYGCDDYEKMIRPDVARTFFPREHLEFFERTELWHSDEHRTYVHAGIEREGFLSMERQTEETLLWIRHEFLFDDSGEGGYVVHGHTPMECGNLPCERPNRVNLDTGAVFGGKLTAGLFVDDQREVSAFIQVPGLPR